MQICACGCGREFPPYTAPNGITKRYFDKRCRYSSDRYLALIRDPGLRDRENIKSRRTKARRARYGGTPPPTAWLFDFLDKTPGPAEVSAYMAALKRDPCGLCGSFENVQIDHIACRHGGGVSHWTNYGALCAACNADKKERSLMEILRRRAVRRALRPLLAEYHGCRVDQVQSRMFVAVI